MADTGRFRDYSQFREREPADDGWVAFAGFLLFIAGLINMVEGFAAANDADWLILEDKFVISSLHLWGWVLLLLGAALILCSIGIFAGRAIAVWAGIVFASLNAIGQLLALPAYPFWSLAMLALDVLVIHGLVTHGRRAAARSAR
jgi:hypothetical protein